LKKKISIHFWNEFGSVQFEKRGSDIIVIYYFCNSSVVNSQQILQWMWQDCSSKQCWSQEWCSVLLV